MLGLHAIDDINKKYLNVSKIDKITLQHSRASTRTPKRTVTNRLI